MRDIQASKYIENKEQCEWLEISFSFMIQQRTIAQQIY